MSRLLFLLPFAPSQSAVDAVAVAHRDIVRLWQPLQHYIYLNLLTNSSGIIELGRPF